VSRTPSAGYSSAELALIFATALLCIAAVAAMFRPQLGFEWPDLGVADLVQAVQRRWRAPN
jgi:hypothetical protein